MTVPSLRVVTIDEAENPPMTIATIPHEEAKASLLPESIESNAAGRLMRNIAVQVTPFSWKNPQDVAALTCAFFIAASSIPAADHFANNFLKFMTKWGIDPESVAYQISRWFVFTIATPPGFFLSFNANFSELLKFFKASFEELCKIFLELTYKEKLAFSLALSSAVVTYRTNYKACEDLTIPFLSHDEILYSVIILSVLRGTSATVTNFKFSRNTLNDLSGTNSTPIMHLIKRSRDKLKKYDRNDSDQRQKFIEVMDTSGLFKHLFCPSQETLDIDKVNDLLNSLCNVIEFDEDNNVEQTQAETSPSYCSFISIIIIQILALLSALYYLASGLATPPDLFNIKNEDDQRALYWTLGIYFGLAAILMNAAIALASLSNVSWSFKSICKLYAPLSIGYALTNGGTSLQNPFPSLPANPELTEMFAIFEGMLTAFVYYFIGNMVIGNVLNNFQNGRHSYLLNNAKNEENFQNYYDGLTPHDQSALVQLLKSYLALALDSSGPLSKFCNKDQNEPVLAKILTPAISQKVATLEQPRQSSPSALVTHSLLRMKKIKSYGGLTLPNGFNRPMTPRLDRPTFLPPPPTTLVRTRTTSDISRNPPLRPEDRVLGNSVYRIK